MENFDPNSAATPDSGIFGLPHTPEKAAVVYLPIPWEVTVSYRTGTAKGPQAILEASRQVDLFDADVERPYERGLAILPESPDVVVWNREGRLEAEKVFAGRGDLSLVNRLGEQLNEWVFQETSRWLSAGKIVGLIGGDHSVPFGAFQAVARHHGSFGILHVDAHSDTRDAYEGFVWSHASIFHNAMEKIPEITRLVQVGIRDFCEAEWVYCKERKERISVHYHREIARKRFAGEAWQTTVRQIISNLPSEVWVSFDIDGLSPAFCPNTGTPVPGGLSFDEANFLIGEVARSGRRILGFDLNEVAPGNDEWDANVGARLLYKLTAWTLASQGLAKLMP